jgi:hypothetical protein
VHVQYQNTLLLCARNKELAALSSEAILVVSQLPQKSASNHLTVWGKNNLGESSSAAAAEKLSVKIKAAAS